MAQGKIVLFACGSFSPPTPMHFRVFEIARDFIHNQGSHTVIGGIVSPVHDGYGKKDLVSASHRCAMIRLALRNSDWIKMSEWEVKQEGWTRTLPTLQHHQNVLNSYLKNRESIIGPPPSWIPDDLLNQSYDDVDHAIPNYSINNGNEGDDFSSSGNVKLKLLCGGDLLESFATPGLWKVEELEMILRDYGIVVITRSGSNPEKFIYDSDILSRFRRNITIITNWVPNDVSSTMIRRLMRRGESVKYLIDDSIITYIKQFQLFGMGSLNLSSNKNGNGC